MSRLSFENYGHKASLGLDPTYVAGRYMSQKEDERNILPDIVNKLDLHPSDVCLEIGCGVGNLLIPLSFLVKSITGVDHPNCISGLKARFTGENMRLISKNFLDCSQDELGCFDKILVYSVLHYLSNRNEVENFVGKALSLLLPGGKMLLGDIPNISRKQRFLKSEKGKEFDNIWKEKNRSPSEAMAEAEKYLADDPNLVILDDAMVLSLMAFIRGQEYHTYILPQSMNLPFGHTREDILVEKPR